MSQKNEINAMLQQALNAQKLGNIALAEETCKQIILIDNNQPDALQFLGLICRNTGRLDAGETLMRRSLEVAPNQPHVWNNLGNLYKAKGNNDDAVECYDKAIGIKPDYKEAYMNKALAYYANRDFETALEGFKDISDKDPNNLAAINMMGSCWQELKQSEKAIDTFEGILEINPEHVMALHNLGLIYKMNNNLDDALSMLERAMTISPNIPEVNYNLGNVLFGLGRLEEAINAFEQTIAIKSDYLDAHKNLNMIYWQHGMTDKHLASYVSTIQSTPNCLPIRHQYADELILHDRMEEAFIVLEEALRVFGDDHKTYALLAHAVRADENPLEAGKHFKKSLQLKDDELNTLLDFSRLLILHKDYDQALGLLDKAEKINPDNQQTIAYQGVCWDQTDDPRGGWLNDMQYVKPFYIEAPEGYDSVEEFNKDLKAALLRMHTAKNQPIEQTLRGGTQTPGGLLKKQVKEVQLARKAFEKAFSQYIAELPFDQTHPLLRRKSENFSISGSWSVRLAGDGFHINHVHPDGWLSSCYYVDVPEVVNDEEQQQGWIKFGETSMYMGDRETIGKVCKPEAGLLVIFPSYMYHGTIPFKSEEHRLTLPMDVVPE